MTPLTPLEPYGVSKMEAEQGLREIAAQTGMEVVIIRPPLVYGPRGEGQFPVHDALAVRGIPLPLGASSTTAAAWWRWTTWSI